MESYLVNRWPGVCLQWRVHDESPFVLLFTRGVAGLPEDGLKLYFHQQKETGLNLYKQDTQ